MAQETRDSSRVRVRSAQRAQCGFHLRKCRCRHARLQFHAQHRLLLSGCADTDQGGAPHLRMHVEDRLHLLGVERAGGGFHAVGLAPAEPQASFGIEVAHIAHAMHDAFAAVRIALADLGDPRGRVAVEVGVGGGGASDGDFAHLAHRQHARAAPLGNGRIVDGDDAHLVRRDDLADASAGTGLGGRAGGIQRTPFDGCHRQAFGGAIRRPELRIFRQQRADLGHHVRRHRRTGRGGQAHVWQGLAVVGQYAHQCRRAEQLRDSEAVDRIVQLARIGSGRAGRIHVRNHRGQPQCRIEQGKRRERRQIHATGLHAKGIAQQFDLADEMPVAVHHALGHAGRAAGEQDGGHIVRPVLAS